MQHIARVMDKIRIFLTDQHRRNAGVTDLSKEIMFTLADFYKKPEKAEGFKDKHHITASHILGLDSGGFQFLMGKLVVPGMVMIKDVPIPVPPNAQATIDLYKKAGVQPQDLPVQLDLPPRYDYPPETKRALIDRTAMYFYEMAEEIPGVIPTVHGWTKAEIEYSLSLFEDPEKFMKVAAGSNAGTANHWTMGNMNPHRELALGSYTAPPKSAIDYIHSTKAAAGTFLAPDKSVVDSVNQHWKNRKPIATGSYKAMMGSFDYTDFIVSRGSPKGSVATGSNLGPTTNYVIDHVKSSIATPCPGGLDIGATTPLIDRIHPSKAKNIIASPAPGLVDAGIIEPKDTPMVRAASKKVVSVGTWIAPVVRNQGPTQKKKTDPKTKPKYTVVLDRIALVLNMLKDDYDVFMLGGASPHMQHQLFMAGAQWTDTSAWRIKGVLAEIYIPEKRERYIGANPNKKKVLHMDDESRRDLKACLQESTHPFCGMSVGRFLEIGRMYMKEWYETWEKNRWEARPFVLRCLHNAWVLKFPEEAIANEFACAPDKYYAYLKRRLKDRPILSKRLRYLHNALEHPYVQEDLRVYLKNRKGDDKMFKSPGVV